MGRSEGHRFQAIPAGQYWVERQAWGQDDPGLLTGLTSTCISVEWDGDAHVPNAMRVKQIPRAKPTRCHIYDSIHSTLLTPKMIERRTDQGWTGVREEEEGGDEGNSMRETAKILLLMGDASIGHVPVSILGVKRY